MSEIGGRGRARSSPLPPPQSQFVQPAREQQESQSAASFHSIQSEARFAGEKVQWEPMGEGESAMGYTRLRLCEFTAGSEGVGVRENQSDTAMTI